MKAYEIMLISTFEDGSQLMAEGGNLPKISQKDPIHEVLQNQSLLDISYLYYRNHGDWVNIYLANDLLNPYDLEIGQKLTIPSIT